ncbi:MAG: hypothetical protein KIH01_08825 [Candidatus Freyarchaeota archaeon]|nr:hypothetical protein [Candidatus Jordarchaeia archaeon]
MKYLRFSLSEPCRFWVQVEGRASRCMLDGSVPICCGCWCEELGSGLYVVACDKLKEVARGLPYAVQTGFDDVDLTLRGGLAPPVHVALLGDSRGAELVLKCLLIDALGKGYMCVQMVLGEPRVPVDAGEGFLLGDLGSFYDVNFNVHLQVEEVARLERSSLERGFQGLLVVFDNSSYLRSRRHAVRPFLFEERMEKTKLRRTICICMYDGGAVSELNRHLIMENHSLVLHVDEPLKIKVLKTKWPSRTLSVTQ